MKRVRILRYPNTKLYKVQRKLFGVWWNVKDQHGKAWTNASNAQYRYNKLIGKDKPVKPEPEIIKDSIEEPNFFGSFTSALFNIHPDSEW